MEEPTFEEILQQAIADVLNEYSNRDRRAVQNFTGEHVQITHMEKGGENISVSMAINSTKLGKIIGFNWGFMLFLFCLVVTKNIKPL